jgi:hypothetical protein
LEASGPLIYRTLTIASVRSASDADHVEILCLPSARIYRLKRARRDFPQLLERLRAAAISRRAVRLGFADERSDVIEDILAEGSGPDADGNHSDP